MTNLSSSSFFLTDYLTTQLSDNNYRAGQLSYALKHNHITALTIQEAKADFGSINWLSLNEKLAKKDGASALKLAYWYQQQTQEKTKIPLLNTAILWFEQAIRLHSQQAIVALAQLYFDQNKLLKAQSTMDKFTKNLQNNSLVEVALILRINIAVALGDVIKVNKLINLGGLSFGDSAQSRDLLTAIEKYAVIKNTPSLSDHIKGRSKVSLNFHSNESQACISSLQLFATNLAHLKHLEVLIKAFNEQQAVAQFICLPIPRYISIKQLDCVSELNAVITCDERLWQNVTQEIDSRHIGLMLNQGGANVHLGILYFDINDGADVFSHEVSHLLGFIDEYPLQKEHYKCQEKQTTPFSHNVAVLDMFYQGERQALRTKILAQIPWSHRIKDNTPILQLVDAKSNKALYWLLGTPVEYQDEIGVYASESCLKSVFTNKLSKNNKDTSHAAFKPIKVHTQLRYFAKEFPKEYLALLNDKPLAFLMPSFHYNIALAEFLQGNIDDAKYWLLQAAQWEKEPLRKETILRGDFR